MLPQNWITKARVVSCKNKLCVSNKTESLVSWFERQHIPVWNQSLNPYQKPHSDLPPFDLLFRGSFRLEHHNCFENWVGWGSFIQNVIESTCLNLIGRGQCSMRLAKIEL